MRSKNTILFLFLFVILLIPSIWGLFHKGMFISDDGSWMIIRLSAFYEALVSGQFPTRFLPQLNNGYGYPVADFLYPLFLYVGSLLHIFRTPFIDAVKILFGFGLIGSGIATYFWLQKRFNKTAAFIGSLVYVYFPYHIYDIYTRGSMGEVLALAVLPFIFSAVESGSILGVGIGTAFLITSHNTLALLFLPVIMLYEYLRRRSLARVIKEVVIGLGLSAFFWLPALWDKQYTVFGNTAVSNPSQYFLTSTTLTLVGWVSVVIFLGIFFIKRFWADKVILFFWIVGLLSILMATSLTDFIWQMSFLRQFVQFPFRFLSLAIPASAIIAAYIIHSFKKNLLLVVLLCSILGFSSLPYLFPKQYNESPESFYTTNMDTTTVQNEYMPMWVNKRAPYNANKFTFLQGTGSVVIQRQKGTSLHAQITSSTPVAVAVGFVYFPGWNVTIDGKNVSVKPQSVSGLLSFSVPQGSHQIHIFFTETPLRLVADMISILTMLALIFYAVKTRKR